MGDVLCEKPFTQHCHLFLTQAPPTPLLSFAEHHSKFYDALDAFQRVSETINDSKMKTGMLREALTECRSYLQVSVDNLSFSQSLALSLFIFCTSMMKCVQIMFIAFYVSVVMIHHTLLQSTRNIFSNWRKYTHSRMTFTFGAALWSLSTHSSSERGYRVCRQSTQSIQR